jgi:hypothetical protein
MKKIALLFILLIITSCASRQRQVWFVETQNAHNSERENTLKVYLDKQGSFYPTENIYIPYKEFFDPKNEANTTKLQQTSGNLEHYFTGKFINKKGKYSYWNYYNYTKRSDRLRKYYKLSNLLSNDETFDKSQERILISNTNSLNELISKTKSKTLVVLIHGFNDANPSADYNMFRNKLKETLNQDLVFLEIFWDGLTANQGSPPTSKIWGYAQYNSSQVAVTVRKILKKINHEFKIRLITHSLGASVGTAALFNTTSKWPRPLELGAYTQMLKNISAPTNKDIRLGMLAPAIPGVSTFKDFNDRGQKTENTINKIVVGHNCNDYAVTKRFFGIDFLSSKAGSTTLGANHKAEVQKVRELLKKSGYDNILSDINFASLKCKKDDEEHGLYYYMKNEVAFTNFINQLFL